MITFNEGVKGSARGDPRMVLSGGNWGEEFVYPKTRAVELAKVTKAPVPALQADVATEVEKPEEPAVVAVLRQVR